MDSRKERSDKDPMRECHPSTAVVHAGYRARLSEGSVKPPVFRTSTFAFPKASDGETSFGRAYHLPGNDGQDPGLVYSRLNNPNTEIYEDKMVAAEVGATHAALFPSGMSAITTAILARVPSGGRILYTTPVYGGTYFFLKEFCPARFGITTVPVDTSDLVETERVLQEHGPFHMVYLETPANPTLGITDIAAVARLARKHCGPNVIVAVDNTFLGPVFQQPFACDADLVLYSATKYLGGHSDLIAGVALTKSKEAMQPILDYRTILGCTTAPDTAWMLARSIETLWLRMERQAEKATKVAHALAEHPKVARVLFPALLTPADGSAYEVYCRQCSGPGAVVTFILKAEDRAAAYRFLDTVEVCHLAVSLGSTESLIEHPRSMTHSDMSLEDLDRCGITEGMIRLSVGLESSTDLIHDLFRALESV
ncbi:MAG: PLP-dependent aspartate aminotransferase family protein [bacterium]|nr:PLP-dependent aspartate aminotransferase family protein [bacterium]